jgi:hypothetical protein
MANQAIPPPRSVIYTRVSQRFASQLVFYGAYGTVGVLAPRGWKCSSTSGSGGVTIAVVNPKAGFWGVSEYRPEEGVTLHEASTGSNHPLYEACPFFPAAKYKLQRQSVALAKSCHQARTYGERSTVVSDWLFKFDDPPRVEGLGSPSGGKNPATGIVVYDNAGVSQQRDRASTVTCTLPKRKRALCAAILNEFITRWR